MNLYDFLPIRLLLEGASWLLHTLSALLQPLVGDESAAAAVILLTIGVRVLLIPVGLSQVRAGITRERLAPELARLQGRYQKNPELLQRKTMELYQRERASPVAGCLPALAQAPVLMAIYGLFILPTIGGAPNQLLEHTLLGVPLGSRLFEMMTSGTLSWTAAALFAALVVLIAVVAQSSRRLLTPPPGSQVSRLTPPRSSGSRSAGAKQAAPSAVPDLSGMVRVLSYLPFLTAAVAVFVPLAAGLYLATTTSWTLIERVTLRKILAPKANPEQP